MDRLVCNVLEIERATDANYQTAIVEKADGGREHVVVPARILEKENGHVLLPVIRVSADRSRNAVLVQLPYEADSGANRVWVSDSQLREGAAV